MANPFDLIVIGAGSGGVAAARRARAHGARVALIEEAGIGGTCVLRGCVPKKLLVGASRATEELEDARAYGYDVRPGPLDWPRLIAAKDAELARLSRVYEGLLAEAQVDVIAGRARLIGPGSVQVGAERYEAKHVLVATGSRPLRPDVPGRELAITSNEALSLPALPARLAVIGAGYVGVELASMFRAFGSEVTLFMRGRALLPGFDRELTRALEEAMAARGVRFVKGADVSALSREADGLRVTSSAGAATADAILAAVGRIPNTDAMGLAEAGVTLGARGEVCVDDAAQTSVPGVYAVGDCTDRKNLTPVALAEGRAVADRLFGPGAAPLDYEAVPSAVFSQPPLASAGLSEEHARERGHDVRCYVKTFRPLKSALTGRTERTTMKVVVDGANDRVLGIHVVGTDAPEMVQGFAVALAAGLTKRTLDQVVGIHPTAAEELVSMRHVRCGPFED